MSENRGPSPESSALPSPPRLLSSWSVLLMVVWMRGKGLGEAPWLQCRSQVDLAAAVSGNQVKLPQTSNDAECVALADIHRHPVATRPETEPDELAGEDQLPGLLSADLDAVDRVQGDEVELDQHSPPTSSQRLLALAGLLRCRLLLAGRVAAVQSGLPLRQQGLQLLIGHGQEPSFSRDPTLALSHFS